MAKSALKFFVYNTLRLVCLKYNQINDCYKGHLGGLYGSHFDDYFQVLGWNVSLSSIHKSIDIGSLRRNGSYDGAVGYLSRNESDFIPLPFNFGFDLMPADYGPVITGVGYQIISIYGEVAHQENDMIDSLRVFSLPIWAAIAFIVAVAWLTLYHLSETSLAESLWITITYLPFQSNYDPIGSKQRLLIVIYSLSCFVLFMGFFCNLLTTDKVTIDLSILVNSLQDVLRLNRTPVFAKTDRLLSLFKDAHNPLYASVWQRSKEAGLSHTLVAMKQSNVLEAIPFFLNRNPSIISYKPIVDILGTTICYLHENTKLWLANEQLFSVSFHLFRRQNMSRAANDALDDFSYRLAESCLVTQNLKLVSEHWLLKLLDTPRNKCLRTDLEVVANEIQYTEDKDQTSFRRMKPLFAWFLLFISFASIVFLKEIIFRIVRQFMGKRRRIEPLFQRQELAMNRKETEQWLETNVQQMMAHSVATRKKAGNALQQELGSSIQFIEVIVDITKDRDNNTKPKEKMGKVLMSKKPIHENTLMYEDKWETISV